jgi:hypothetical protein
MNDQELREAQYDAALCYVQGTRDHFLVVDWKSVWYYASLFAKKETDK